MRPDVRRHPTARAAGTALVALLAAPAAAQPVPPRATTPVVLVSIDGLKPEYVRDADRLGLRIPTLRALAAAAARARGVMGVVPTLTYPSHVTLVTGAAPARHGVESNTTFDPLRHNEGGWYWYASDVRVPTLWDAAAARGLASAAVHWPVSVNAAITYNLPQVWRAGTADDRKLVRALATPGLVDSLERRVGVPYPDGIDESVAADERRARFAARLIEWKRPALALAYLTALDHEQHQHGPYSPEAFAVLERVDAALDTVVAAVRRAYGGRATVAVVSDHGFARTSTEVQLGVAFAHAGLLTVPDTGEERPTAWRAAVWPAGGSAAVVLADTTDSVLARRTRALLDSLAADSANGIARVLERAELARLGGFPSAEWLVAFRPGYRVGARLRGPLRAAVGGGWHGYLPGEPEMRATFLIAGPGIPAGLDLGVVDMRDVAPTLAARLGVVLAAAEGRDRLAGLPAAWAAKIASTHAPRAPAARSGGPPRPPGPR